MLPFDFHPRTRIIFGPDTVTQIGELARDLRMQRILLVTDPGIVAAGHAGRVQELLDPTTRSITVFDTVHENPTTRDVDACLAVARAADVDGIVGLGGGSSLDVAKGCNFLLTGGGVMSDYWGVGKATRPMLPMIAVPTTAGTGSECQSFALIADEKTHQKMACGDPKAAARIALLDPRLTLTQPPRVTAATAVDALAHAVETAVTSKRTPLSLLFSREAFRQIHGALGRVAAQPDDVEARGAMQLGAAFAGLAIENSMLGAAHSAANPLTAHYNVVHGEAVGLMLPHVVRFNSAAADASEGYAQLAMSCAAQNGGAAKGGRAVDDLVGCIESLLDGAGIPRSLEAHGVPRDAIGMLADEAARQWTVRFNPRTVGAEQFARLYEEAYGAG